MGIIIEGRQKNISIHRSFWNAITENGSDTLALSQLWLCGIDKNKLKSITDKLNKDINRYEEKSWEIDIGSVVLDSSKWDSVTPSTTTGAVYLLSRGVSFIGDGINTTRVGVSQIGAHKGLISDGRNELSTVNITFLETNISFADGVLRPWSILVGYRSLKDQSLRCDIELYALEKWELKQPFKVRKSLVLKNAVPVSIDTEEYNYTGDKLIERQVQFAFDRYEMRIYPMVTKEPHAENGGLIIEWDKKDEVQDDSNIKGSINTEVQDDFSINGSINTEVQDDFSINGSINTEVQDDFSINGSINNEIVDDEFIRVEYNNNIRDFSTIYVNNNKYRRDHEKIRGDINSDFIDNPSINRDINDNISDNINIKRNLDINLDITSESKPNIISDLADINSDFTDNPSINGDINDNISDNINIKEDLNINPNIISEPKPNIINNPTDEIPSIQTDISNYTKDNIIINMNNKQDIKDNMNIKMSIKPDELNTSSEIRYIQQNSSLDAPKIKWTPGRIIEDNPVILSNIKPNYSNTTSVRS
jgi:hypothetical protein